MLDRYVAVLGIYLHSIDVNRYVAVLEFTYIVLMLTDMLLFWNLLTLY